jgi:pyridoxamine 5'-phosphate oxidase
MHWIGYRVVALAIELWQGRADNVHDRLRYLRADAASPWSVARVSP